MYNLIEKIATSKKEFEEWESKLEPQIKRERDLIKAVQQYDDKFAMKELIRLYRGPISQAASRSQLSMQMDDAMAYSYGVEAFKKIIKDYFKLDVPIRPSYYIIGRLQDLLNKKKDALRDVAARKSSDLTIKAGYNSLAESFLTRELGRTPTIKEKYDFIKNDLGKKNVSMANLQRIESLNRRELLGDQRIGRGDTNAEYLTLLDIKNVDKITPEQILQNQQLKQEVEKQLHNFNRKERRLIRHFLGLGEFINRPAKSLNEAAGNNMMTHYEARKTIEKLKEIMKDKIF